MTQNKSKSIDNQLLMELNIIELPLFKLDKAPKGIEESDRVEQYEKCWVDSYGIKRKIKMSCDIRLPRNTEMDLIYALMGLYIRQNSPIIYDAENKKYDVKSKRVYFSMYELLKYMGKKISGTNVNNIKKSIRILHNTNFQSLENGVVYDKEDKKYVISNEKGFHIINDYNFKSKKLKDSQIEIEENWVEFNDVIMKNIRNSYFKYIDHGIYFSLQSGLTRRLYVYLERHKWQNNKIRKVLRLKYTTLSYKLPVEFEYLSLLKRRLKLCEEKLKAIKFITDVDYGDEFVDYYFVGKKEDYIEKIEEEEDEEPRTYLRKLSDDLHKEIVDRGVEPKIVKKLIHFQDKWDIIKKILYVDKQLILKKIEKNYAGLLRTALESEIFQVYDKDIIDFVEALKQEEIEQKHEEEKSYSDYISEVVEKFKKEDMNMYEILREQAYKAIESNPANILSVEENRKDFIENKYNSTLVQNKLFSLLKVHLNLMSQEKYNLNKLEA